MLEIGLFYFMWWFGSLCITCVISFVHTHASVHLCVCVCGCVCVLVCMSLCLQLKLKREFQKCDCELALWL